MKQSLLLILCFLIPFYWCYSNSSLKNNNSNKELQKKLKGKQNKDILIKQKLEKQNKIKYSKLVKKQQNSLDKRKRRKS